MKKEVFISHSTKDVKIATSICHYLENNNISCFIAPRDLEPGKIYGEEIIRGIDESNYMILVASEHSFHSQHVLREIERAVNRNMKIFVYKIDNAPVPKAFEYFIMVSQWLDASASSKITQLTNVIKQSQNGNENVEDESYKTSIYINRRKIWILMGIVAFVLIIACTIIYKNVVHNKKSNLPDMNEDKTIIANENEDSNPEEQRNKVYAVGDVITLGNYNGKPIEWVVLNIDENNNAFILSKDIISIKSFDCANSGIWNKIDDSTDFNREKESEYSDTQLMNAKGCNCWQDSSIRTWLNSKQQKVQYNHTPNVNSLYDSRIAYDKEAGFLTSFTQKELNQIVKQGEDYVFLPSIEEVNDYIINGEVIFPEAKLTNEAIEADKTNEINSIAKQYDGNFAWMTRSADDNCCYKIIDVLGSSYTKNGSDFYSDTVGYPRGVRPAMIIK